jgi:hypothetical protein
MTKRKEKKPAHVTVAELQTTLGVPLHVQVWLERFARGDEYALQKFGCDDESGVNEAAFLIYDVLEAQYGGSNAFESSELARDFVEEWLYTLSNYYGQHIWNNPDAALTLLPWVIDNSGGSPMLPEGDAAYVLLRTAIERLTTKSERRAFLRRDAEQEADGEEETDERASFKLARVLADRGHREKRGGICATC